MLSIVLLAIPSTETILLPRIHQHNLSSLLSEVPSTVRSSRITFEILLVFFNFTEVQLIYSVVSVSAVHQHVSVNMSILFYICFCC